MANLRETGGIRFEPTSFATSGDVVFSEWIGRGLGQASGVPIMESSASDTLRLRDTAALYADEVAFA